MGIDSTSLREYLMNIFEGYYHSKFDFVFGPSDSGASEIIRELNDIGIMHISQLDAIIPQDLPNKAPEEFTCYFIMDK